MKTPLGVCVCFRGPKMTNVASVARAHHRTPKMLVSLHLLLGVDVRVVGIFFFFCFFVNR